jgi:hypothetical protein
LLLLALQTTTSAADDGRIDTLSLVLVVIFIAAMLALSLLIHRRESSDPDESTPERQRPAAPTRSELLETPPRRDRPAPSPPAATPVWLQGVTIPVAGASLADVTRVIESLLAARRDHDLIAALALYAPEPRDALRERLGIDEASSTEVVFDGDPPALRSAEFVEESATRIKVRAAYSNGASEIYTLVWFDGAWHIEVITAAR